MEQSKHVSELAAHASLCLALSTKCIGNTQYKHVPICFSLYKYFWLDVLLVTVGKTSFVPEMSMTKQSELHLKLPTGHSSAFPSLLPACWVRFTTSILPKAPFLRLFLTHIWPDLVSHSTQNIWGRLCRNNERFHHRWWDLAEDSSYCSSDPSVLMLTSSSLIDGLGCVRNPL